MKEWISHFVKERICNEMSMLKSMSKLYNHLIKYSRTVCHIHWHFKVVPGIHSADRTWLQKPITWKRLLQYFSKNSRWIHNVWQNLALTDKDVPLWQWSNPIDKTPIGGQGASPYSIIGERQTDSRTSWGIFCKKCEVFRIALLHEASCTGW